MHALINMAKRQEASQALSKVKKFIALAGAVARLRKAEDPDWTAMLDDAFATDRVRVGSRNTNVGPLQDAYRLVHDKAATIPQSIEAICIHPHGDSQAGLDEVIPTEASVDLIVSLDRGVLILDKMQKADKQTGTSVHDMSKLQTKHLLEIIDLPPIKGKTILLLDERGLH